jgi:hypothetical protein
MPREVRNLSIEEAQAQLEETLRTNCVAGARRRNDRFAASEQAAIDELERLERRSGEHEPVLADRIARRPGRPTSANQTRPLGGGR